MQNDWLILKWWDAVEIETILRHAINIEGSLIIGAAAIFIVWHRWVQWSDRRLRQGLDECMELISKYVIDGKGAADLSSLYRRKSTYFLLQLAYRLDALRSSDLNQEKRKDAIRRHLFENVIVLRARVLARSILAGRRAMAVNCFRLLSRVEDDSVLIELMRDAVPVIKLGAARLAMRIGTEASVSAILQFLEKEKRYVRNLLQHSAKEASDEFVEKVLRHMHAIKDDYTQKLCLDLISSRLTDDRDSDKVLEFIKSTNKELRISAARALCRSKCKKAYTAVSQTIHDPEWEVRAVSCHLLGRYQFGEGIPLLAERCHDPDWWVRNNASFALLELGAKGEVTLQHLTTGSDRFAKEIAELALKARTAANTAVSA